jgi:aryl-alcohol dehydrogenase-like predicted oxidoreductase
MEYRLLGLSGCAVSALALGTLTFGNETSEADSFTQLDRFVSAGGTLIDTADADAGDLDLGEDETRLLDEASDPGAPDYPYGERGQTQRDRRISGGRF